MKFSKNLFNQFKLQTIKNIQNVKDTEIQKLFNTLDIIKKKREVQLKDTTVGDQWKYKTDDMTDINSWISHISQKQANKRAGLFHYQEILEC